MATPPKRAAAPTAPVFTAAAPPFDLLEDAACVVADPAAATLVVGVAIPEVKGTSLTELAPEKAGTAVVAVVFAEAMVLLGFNTLSRVLVGGIGSSVRSGLTR